ncbi:adenosylcobinamide-phosphate synthase CbiB [Caenimonas soli]|uniref:adenosylcobinamide-phosphate synthase CbiB n=1 Tax=Caenimonas soli TaxID=2735555 RepID=UPI00155441EA|nr:adenosylcobinamide-phosphate synthase CbiB [Caenimonas soli]NPC57566.1 cobalamin biosynthesis protein CobD [Caenimonas soli]
MALAPWTAVIAVLFAFWLDRAFGEPPVRWHPVVWMGKYLGWFGGRVAPREVLAAADWRAFSAGALAWYGGAMLAGLAAFLLQSSLLPLGQVVAGLLLGVLLKPLFSWRMLHSEVTAVETELGRSLHAGRRQLGRLVSRDVVRLTDEEVRESAIESLAENLNDSVVAPMFWFVVAGLPGAVVYRFANTADAMWGYRHMRAGLYWEWAGKWAARADDVLSWVPARITALLLAVSAGGLPLRQLRREAARTPSPNSGWPMAAMALALGVRLRKPGGYSLHGVGAQAQAGDTGRAVELAKRSIALLLLIASVAVFAIAQEWPW